MKFSSHRKYELQIQSNILIVDSTGPFNENVVTAYNRDLKKCMDILSDSPWGQVIIMHDLSLFTPDGEKLLMDSLKTRKEKGLVASAVVCDSEYVIVKEQIARIYRTMDVRHAFFNSKDEALVWIAGELLKQRRV